MPSNSDNKESDNRTSDSWGTQPSSSRNRSRGGTPASGSLGGSSRSQSAGVTSPTERSSTGPLPAGVFLNPTQSTNQIPPSGMGAYDQAAFNQLSAALAIAQLASGSMNETQDPFHALASASPPFPAPAGFIPHQLPRGQQLQSPSGSPWPQQWQTYGQTFSPGAFDPQQLPFPFGSGPPLAGPSSPPFGGSPQRGNAVPHAASSSSGAAAARTSSDSPETVQDELDEASILEDKRRRNTAASSRFRIKKKQRMLNLERSVSDLTGRAEDLEREAADLRRENGWLKEMLMMKARKNLRERKGSGDGPDESEDEESDSEEEKKPSNSRDKKGKHKETRIGKKFHD